MKRNLKILLVIIDGLGDRPIPELGNKTPLEAAKTPNLDFLAKKGVCGLIKPFYTTAIPTSEETHFSLFGYNPKIYRIGRGLIEAKALNIKLKSGDVVLRGNFGTVDKNLNMIDRRAGRITDNRPLIKNLSGKVIEGIKFLIYPIAEHRIVLILRGKNLSEKISDSDPHYRKLGKKAKKTVPLDKSFNAKFTAKVLNKFLFKTHQILKNHPLNKKRERANLPSANYILTRGAGSFKKLPTFKEKYNLRACCIAGKNLYKGIAKILGMDLIEVRRADGSPNTNLKGKILAAKKALKKPVSPQAKRNRGAEPGYDFVFLHIKAADSLAEDGNFLGKKKFIEKIDRNIKPILGLKNIIIVITADHSTCSLLKRHCQEPCPVLIFGRHLPTAQQGITKEFSEKTCRKGKLGKIKQINLMRKILNLAK